MTQEETRAYYDDPINERAMCDLLMDAHPGWVVWRLGRDRTLRPVPLWCARREGWCAAQAPLMDENAGQLNRAMAMVDAGAVAT
ncbi:hypothetical protein SAMN05444920_12539 [Nonomuraea solani]|uniref:Uncharacterized protein n=1 Tax=Nonomuraea solani TaxID=1144553 RepID=A0A1H6EWV3_9ACTN|nr:hypothetical protein [Nonomuraea solani]SEH02252.1 hypothetical protein SAMN05444920_12539 [Nonomuraea solani]